MTFVNYPETSEMSIEQLLEEYKKTDDEFWIECLEGELMERGHEEEI